MDDYFHRYCDYTGGLGIHHDPVHAFDYKFRQHLKKTDDRELKRLFVLEHLYRDLYFELHNYKLGQVRVGKTEYLKMTPKEMQKARARISEMLNDLEAFDPEDSMGEIARGRKKLK